MYQSINEKILNTNLLQKEDLNLFNEFVVIIFHLALPMNPESSVALL